MHPIVLEDFLNDLAVIRTTFETLDLFPPDDSIYGEMREIITEAQRDLIRKVESVCEAIQAKSAALPFPLREFQIEMIKGITKGWDRKSLNHFMKTNTFDEGQSSLYYFEAAGLIDMDTAHEMPAQEFVLIIFQALLHQIKKPENYAAKQTFEREIFQPIFFILFISYSITDPPFYKLKPR